jgi:toxin ParE1/3/4
MAQGLVWSLRAEENLLAIHEFIARDSEVYASRFVERLVIATEHHLPMNRLLGRAVPEFTDTPLLFLREFIFHGYRIIYDPRNESKVVIIAVLNGRMKIEKQFEIG